MRQYQISLFAHSLLSLTHDSDIRQSDITIYSLHILYFSLSLHFYLCIFPFSLPPSISLSLTLSLSVSPSPYHLSPSWSNLITSITVVIFIISIIFIIYLFLLFLLLHYFDILSLPYFRYIYIFSSFPVDKSADHGSQNFSKCHLYNRPRIVRSSRTYIFIRSKLFGTISILFVYLLIYENKYKKCTKNVRKMYEINNIYRDRIFFINKNFYLYGNRFACLFDCFNIFPDLFNSCDLSFNFFIIKY